MASEMENANRVALEIYKLLVNEVHGPDEGMLICATVMFSINANKPEPEPLYDLCGRIYTLFESMREKIESGTMEVTVFERERRQ